MDERRFHTPGPIELDVSIPAGDVEVETIDGEEALVADRRDAGEVFAERLDVAVDLHDGSMTSRRHHCQVIVTLYRRQRSPQYLAVFGQG